MNSSFSNNEKSMEECINYNFDSNLSDIAKLRLNKSKNKDNQIVKKLTKWIDFSGKYPWLYLLNNNPNCTFCEQAFKEIDEMVKTCWTSSETQLVITESTWDEAQILSNHSESQNHILATKFVTNNNNDTETINKTNKSQKENKKTSSEDCPDSLDKPLWDSMTTKFPWLSFKAGSFRCSVCEDAFNRDSKSLICNQWTTPDRVRQSIAKTVPSVAQFEKHEQSQNHRKAFEIIHRVSGPNLRSSRSTESVKNSKKDEILTKTTSSPRRKSVMYLSPNVTTRTASRLSAIDKTSPVSKVTVVDKDDLWTECRKQFPWVFVDDGSTVIRCNFCEQTYKTHHNKSMISTNWTCPPFLDTVASIDPNSLLTLDKLKSKSRLIYHESTRNHEIATNYISSLTTKTTTKIGTSPRKVGRRSQNNFPMLRTGRMSRKSAPMKLSNMAPHSGSSSCSSSSRQAKLPLVSNHSQGKSKKVNIEAFDCSIVSNDRYPSDSELFRSVSLFLTKSQFNYVRSHYNWFYLTNDGTTYACRICVSASNKSTQKTSSLPLPGNPFVTGEEKIHPRTTYLQFRKKLYQHEECSYHNEACRVMGMEPGHGSGREPRDNQRMTTPIEDRTRFTRLKSGERFKVDYKRMSEGYIETVDYKNDVRSSVHSCSGPVKRKQPLRSPARLRSPNWTCPQCKSNFAKTDDLIQHISLCDYQPTITVARGTKQQMICCPCNPSLYRFGTITKLDLHAAQEHDNQTHFHCYICSDRYNRLSTLYHHVLIHHLINWDPFLAFMESSFSSSSSSTSSDYVPTGQQNQFQEGEPYQFQCCFCSANPFSSNTLLTKHYCQSDCNRFLNVSVVLQDLSYNPHVAMTTVPDQIELSLQATSSLSAPAEEVTILEVDELPENEAQKPEHFYSPVKRSRNQFCLTGDSTKKNDRITRRKSYSLRRMGSNLSNGGIVSTAAPLSSTTEVIDNDLQNSVEDGAQKSIDKMKELEIKLFNIENCASSATKEENEQECNFEIIDLKIDEELKPIEMVEEKLVETTEECDCTDVDSKPKQENQEEEEKEEKQGTSEKSFSNKSIDTNAVQEIDGTEHQSDDRRLVETEIETKSETVVNDDRLKIDNKDASPVINTSSNNNKLETDIDSIIESIINPSEKINQPIVLEDSSRIVSNESNFTEIVDRYGKDCTQSGILPSCLSEPSPSSLTTDTLIKKPRKKRMSKRMKLELLQQQRPENDVDKNEGKEHSQQNPIITTTTKIADESGNQSIIQSEPVVKKAKRKYVRRSEKAILLGDHEGKDRPPILMELSQLVDLNDIIKESKINNNNNNKSIMSSVTTTTGSIRPKKQSVQIQSQLSPWKKLKTVDRAPTVNNSVPDVDGNVICGGGGGGGGISFMDRMRKIRQLKKYRSEQKREQMMALDRQLAEINERCRIDSRIDRTDLIRKLLAEQDASSEHDGTREYLKSIIQLEPKLSSPSRMRKAEKRKLSGTAALGGIEPEVTKYMRIDNESTRNTGGSNNNKSPLSTSIQSLSPVTLTTINRQSSTPGSEKKHKSLEQNNRFVPCDVCQMTFKSLRARDNHTTTVHKGLKLFSCHCCQLSFTTHILLRKHAQKYHSDNVSFAVFGPMATTVAGDTGVDAHRNGNSGSMINCFSFQCTFCPLQFTSRSGLNHHITSGHKNDTMMDRSTGGTGTENGSLQPSSSMLVPDEFVVKLSEADPSFSPQCCLICQEVLDNEFELEIHTIEHEREINEKSKPAQFACPKCCRLFFGRDGKSYLKDHYHIVHLEKQAPICEECGTKFSSTMCFNHHRKVMGKNCSSKRSLLATTITTTATMATSSSSSEVLLGSTNGDKLNETAISAVSSVIDPYEKLNESTRLAFVCNKCQTLVAGESAESRFLQHQSECAILFESSLSNIDRNKVNDIESAPKDGVTVAKSDDTVVKGDVTICKSDDNVVIGEVTEVDKRDEVVDSSTVTLGNEVGTVSDDTAGGVNGDDDHAFSSDTSFLCPQDHLQTSTVTTDTATPERLTGQ